MKVEQILRILKSIVEIIEVYILYKESKLKNITPSEGAENVDSTK